MHGMGHWILKRTTKSNIVQALSYKLPFLCEVTLYEIRVDGIFTHFPHSACCTTCSVKYPSWSERENQQNATVRCLFLTISQYVSGIIMPIFRRTRQTYVTACGMLRCNKRGKLDISFNVFFVWCCVVNLDGISCVYENVVCKLVCRGVGLVYVSCAFQVWCTGAGALMHALCLLVGRGVWCRCY